MQIRIVGSVDEVRAILKKKDGAELPRPFEVVKFHDKLTGGCVKVNYNLGQSGLTVGQDVDLSMIVKGNERNFNINYQFISAVTPEPVVAVKNKL